MSEIIKLTPEELENFARNLKRFSETLHQDFSYLTGYVRNLSTHWDDPANKRWEAEFDQASKVILQFLRASEEHYSFLMKKAHLSRIARELRQ